MRGVVDHVLALLPFVPPYMQAAGMTCDFVGHPVVAEPQATADEIAAFRDFYNVGDAPVVLALPGSRAGEVTRLSDVFGQALQKLEAERPEIRVFVPAAGAVASLVQAQVANWPGQPVVLDPRDRTDPLAWKRAAFGAADVALAASGTVSLELAASATPMVIAYDMNWVSRQMIRRLLRVDTVTLVNLVSDTRAVPEFLGDDCKPDQIAAALGEVLKEPGAQLDACAVTMERLGHGDEAPGVRAARSVMTAAFR
jgi:lipid-A-disaccharide synthase